MLWPSKTSRDWGDFFDIPQSSSSRLGLELIAKFSSIDPGIIYHPYIHSIQEYLRENYNIDLSAFWMDNFWIEYYCKMSFGEIQVLIPKPQSTYSRAIIDALEMLLTTEILTKHV